MSLGNGAVLDTDVIAATAANGDHHSLHVETVRLGIVVRFADVDFWHDAIGYGCAIAIYTR